MTDILKRLSPYPLWVLLSLPAFGLVVEVITSDNPRIYELNLHPPGEISAILLAITLMATPLAMLLRGWRGPQWLKKNRRYLGVASFGYAVLHTIFYVLDVATVAKIVEQLPRFYIWTGWAALAIFIPLALTSTDYFVRRMGTGWKRLQRWTYAAAVLTLLHWVSLDDWSNPGEAMWPFAPLIALQIYRLWYWYGPRKRRAGTA